MIPGKLFAPVAFNHVVIQFVLGEPYDFPPQR
jgi:hypothetical protein